MHIYSVLKAVRVHSKSEREKTDESPRKAIQRAGLK